MRTIEQVVYSFCELSDDAKERAVTDYWNEGHNFAWEGENLDSLKKFYDVFSSLVKSGNRNWSDVCIIGDDNVMELSGMRAATYLWNNYKDDLYKGKYYSRGGKSRYSKIQLCNCCVLTGYCMDDDILKPIYKFLSKPDQRTIEDLMQECVESWRIACEHDYEYQQTQAWFEDMADANDWEFTEDGKFV
jgi:hypothetical protein